MDYSFVFDFCLQHDDNELFVLVMCFYICALSVIKWITNQETFHNCVVKSKF